MKLIQDLGMQYATEKSKRKQRYGLYECPICEKHFRVSTNSVNTKNTTKCKSCSVKIQMTTHGDTGSKLHNVWNSMRSRCSHQYDKSYKNYGERGINVCKEWASNYLVFKEWALENGYREGLSIDRIDNDKGYSPNNCRWTTDIIQGRNKRRLSARNKSGYRGVYFDTNRNKFTASIRAGGLRKHLGRFDTALEAGMAYDRYVIQNKLEHTTNGLF